MREILIVCHNGKVGSYDYSRNKICMLGSYKEDTFDVDLLKILTKNYQDTLYVVPNRVAHICTQEGIPCKVHGQPYIKHYLKVFNKIDSQPNRSISNGR